MRVWCVCVCVCVRACVCECMCVCVCVDAVSELIAQINEFRGDDENSTDGNEEKDKLRWTVDGGQWTVNGFGVFEFRLMFARK